MTRTARPIPGSCLVDWPPALAACALAANVFFLRVHHPGWLSGKLSDLAINFLLPVTLVAATEWAIAIAGWMAGRPFTRTHAPLRLAACAVSALYFALLQMEPGFSQVHASLLHILDLPLGGDRSFAGNIADPGDLIALATAPLAAIYLGTFRRLVTTETGKGRQPTPPSPRVCERARSARLATSRPVTSYRRAVARRWHRPARWPRAVQLGRSVVPARFRPRRSRPIRRRACREHGSLRCAPGRCRTRA